MSASEIAAANAALCAAIAAGDAEAAAACYTPDGAFLLPAMEALAGREAIAGFFAGAFANGITGLDLVTDELEFLGDTAWEGGRYTLHAGDTVADHGKFIVVWKRQDGAWLLHRDIVSTNVPAAA